MKEGKNLMSGLLVTLGCSWVKGVGAQYVDGMTLEQYQEVTEKGYRELDTLHIYTSSSREK